MKCSACGYEPCICAEILMAKTNLEYEEMNAELDAEFAAIDTEYAAMCAELDAELAAIDIDISI